MLDFKNYVLNSVVLLLGIHVLFETYIYRGLDIQLVSFYIGLSVIQTFNLLNIESQNKPIDNYSFHHFYATYFVGLHILGLLLGLIMFFDYEFIKATYCMFIVLFAIAKFSILENIKNKYLL